MKTFIFLVLVLVLVLVAFTVVIAALKAKQKTSAKGEELPAVRGIRTAITARAPLTDREQGMYHRLTTAFPHHVVLAQVAMSALLKTAGNPTRATFDRKVIDFVLCSKAFDVLAVIELDDHSHKGKEERDAARDAMLTAAGYQTLRYANTPDAAVLINDITRLTAARAPIHTVVGGGR